MIPPFFQLRSPHLPTTSSVAGSQPGGPFGRAWSAAAAFFAVVASACLSAWLWLEVGGVRFVAYGLLALAALVPVVFIARRMIRRRRQRLIDAALPGSDDGDALGGQLREGIAYLDRNGIDRYTQPTFLLLGEPKAGKTQSVESSGLGLPIGCIKNDPGGGGTLGCNWWFTDSATIIDAAGHYVMDSSPAAAGGGDDQSPPEPEVREAWLHFLDEVRRHKPRAPINGVIVAIPCDRLIADDAETRRHKANRLRDALLEIQQRTGVRFPVTVLLTKADRIGGFREFFAALLKRRHQMFGWSRPDERRQKGRRFTGDEAREATSDLVRTLRDFRLSALHDSRMALGSPEAGRLMAFPNELDNLRDRIADYLATIFDPGPQYAAATKPEFRGFYLTSAIQRDHALSTALGELFGDDARFAPDANDPDRRDPCFLADVYREKALPEAGLVEPSVAWLKWRRRLRQHAAAAAIVAGIAAAGIVAFDLRNVRAATGEFQQILALADPNSRDYRPREALNLLFRLDRQAGVGDDVVRTSYFGELGDGKAMYSGLVTPGARSRQAALAQPMFDLATHLLLDLGGGKPLERVAVRLNAATDADLRTPDDYLRHERATLAIATLAGAKPAPEGFATDQAQWFDTLADVAADTSGDSSRSLAAYLDDFGRALATNPQLSPAFRGDVPAVDQALDAIAARWEAYLRPTPETFGWPAPVSVPGGLVTIEQVEAVDERLMTVPAEGLDDDAIGRLRNFRLAIASIRSKLVAETTDDVLAAGAGLDKVQREVSHRLPRLLQAFHAESTLPKAPRQTRTRDDLADRHDRWVRAHNQQLFRMLRQDDGPALGAWAFPPIDHDPSRPLDPPVVVWGGTTPDRPIHESVRQTLDNLQRLIALADDGTSDEERVVQRQAALDNLDAGIIDLLELERDAKGMIELLGGNVRRPARAAVFRDLGLIPADRFAAARLDLYQLWKLLDSHPLLPEKNQDMPAKMATSNLAYRLDQFMTAEWTRIDEEHLDRLVQEDPQALRALLVNAEQVARTVAGAGTVTGEADPQWADVPAADLVGRRLDAVAARHRDLPLDDLRGMLTFRPAQADNQVLRRFDETSVRAAAEEHVIRAERALARAVDELDLRRPDDLVAWARDADDFDAVVIAATRLLDFVSIVDASNPSAEVVDVLQAVVSSRRHTPAFELARELSAWRSWVRAMVAAADSDADQPVELRIFHDLVQVGIGIGDVDRGYRSAALVRASLGELVGDRIQLRSLHDPRFEGSTQSPSFLALVATNGCSVGGGIETSLEIPPADAPGAPARVRLRLTEGAPEPRVNLVPFSTINERLSELPRDPEVSAREEHRSR